MKRIMISLLAAVLLLFFALPVDMLAASPLAIPTADLGSSPVEIVVRFKPGTTPWEMAMVHGRAGGRVNATIPAIGVQVVTVPARTAAARMRSYAAHPRVMYAEPNYIAEIIAEPNDPYFSSQWGLHKVEAPAAWDITTGSGGMSIAILDTGVDPNHPDLRDKIVKNVNFTYSSTVGDVHGHGTHVAGIAAASTNNGIGVAGLGYDSTIMNVKVLGDSGSGYYSWVTSGIIWAADNGAQVINMSLGGTAGSRALEDAINYAWSKGVVVVAAAGNSGTSSPFYPAFYANCMAVAATDANDAKASWSNYGDWVDVAAPGVSIYSTLRGTSYGYKSGTSMASPHVAGLAALVFTTVSDVNGNGLLNDEARARIESTCDDIGVSGIGAGRINAAQAVQGDETEPQPDVQIVKIADPTSVSEAGTLVTYTYTVTNTGEAILTAIAVTDDVLGSITLATTTLPLGSFTTGTATYTVTQADIDSGAEIVNMATVTCDQGVTDSYSATVTMEAPDPAGVTISLADRSGRGWPGEDVAYEFTVRNTGGVADTYDISVASVWTSYVTPQSLTLDPGATATIVINHSVPGSVSSGDSDAGTVQALSLQTGASASASFTTTTRVAAVEITPGAQNAAGAPGETAKYTYTISNTGTEDDVYDLAASAAWAASPSAASVSLKAGESAQVVVSHAIPEGAEVGTSDSGTLSASSARASAGATFTTTLEEEKEPVPPVIDEFRLTNNSSRLWALVTVDWAVSDEDGDLATVSVLMILNGRIVDSATFSVAGYEASGSCQLRHRSRRGTTYQITLIVRDASGNSASQTTSFSS